MKKIALIASILLAVANAFAQSIDAQKFIELYQNPKSDSLVPFCRSLFESGRTDAALTLLEKETSGKALELKQNIELFNKGEGYYISSEFSKATDEFAGFSIRVRATKNKKLKKEILDSLIAIQPKSIYYQVAKMNALVEISMMLHDKKNAEKAINETIEKSAEIKDIIVKSFVINQEINACLLSKNTKRLKELNLQQEEAKSSIVEMNRIFAREILNTAATKKEAPKEVVVKQPETKSNSSLIIIVALGVLVCLLAILFVVNAGKKNKQIEALTKKMNDLESRTNHDADIQNQSIRHHEIQLLDARNRIDSLESKNSSLIKQYSENLELLDQQVAEYQSDLKAAIDRVTRENSVQNMMELNNVLARNGQKIRENIKSIRI